MKEEEIFKLARYLFEKQLQQITEALLQVLSRFEDGYNVPLVMAGAGSFLTVEIGRRLSMTTVDAEKEWGKKVMSTLPSLAAAYLLAKKLEAKRQ